MTLRHFDFIMKVAVLLALLAVSECSSSSVVGQTGQNVTLPCKYDIKKYSQLSVCWGRGELPASGCNNLLVSTDGQKVKGRDSSRYQLLGRLDEGDVSLTILNVKASDAGRYGCKVEIPGWFNDVIYHFQLIVEEAAQTTTRAGNRETSTEQPAADPTTGQLTSTETLLTSSSSSIKLEENSSATLVRVFVVFGVVALVTVGGFFIIGSGFIRRLQEADLRDPEQI
ncbi:T-cell immunoglobulin and mucin domain-containing protein 4-like [Chelmon rostratus]|uniref:T-cell immunoglobulin and mucin domain-containing protein 4-like n=1 Tax=Chelmon rostratus TaxID=109905 RepID=UPI001BE765A8|nr:T-cell immunoglobulin and mucin domain-containing protein 4-like [Chelmon rostratus]